MNKYKNIFIVDDDKTYQFILKNLLKKTEFDIQPLFFENGQDALKILIEKIENNACPDLILLDINMPVMNGWQFLEEVRLLKFKFIFNTNINLITSSNDIMDLRRAKSFENEISNYYLKPITLDDILNMFVC